MLTEFTLLRLHLLLIPVTVVVIVGIMFHVLEAQAGYTGHVRAHLLGAPVGWEREALVDSGRTGQAVGPVMSPEILLL